MSDKNILPTGWIDAKVGDVIKVRNGCAFKSTDYCEAGIPVVRQAELKGRTVDLSAAKYLPESFLDDFEAFIVKKGDLLIGMSGSLGKVARYESETIALQNQRTGLLVLTPAINESFAGMMMRRLETAIIQKGKGIAVQNVSSKEIENERFSLPPLAEQIRIASRFDELESDLDAGVAALKRAKANLKRYRASVLKAAVEGKLTEQWRAKHPAKEPASALLARILKERRLKWEADQLAKFAAAKKEPPKNWRDKYVEPTPPDTTGLSKLPDGWCWASVDQVAQFTRYGSSAKTNEEVTGVPVIRMGNIKDGTLDYSELKFLPHGHPEFPDLLLKKGDLLFNRTNSAELVGKSAVYDGQYDPCSFASYLISVRCLAGCDPAFLCFYINSTYGRRWVKSVVSQQVGQANVNGSKLQSLAFPLPSVAEQIEIVTEVAEKLYQIEATANTIDHDLLRAARLRQSILKRAFEGKLVPQDPKDEPASALLERMRASRAIHERSGNRPSSAIPHRSKSRGKKS